MNNLTLSDLDFSKLDLLILMPAYNSGAYISQAISSVIEQKTSYSYRILVLDDCSTDNTCEIVDYYRNLYPSQITLLKSNKNQGLFANTLRGYELTKSRYFCVLDADDYWDDELKIQKALDFFEHNKDFTIYSANFKILNLDGTYENRYNIEENDQTGSFYDAVEGKVKISTSLTTVYRNVVFSKSVPKILYQVKGKIEERAFIADAYRHIVHAQKGKIFYTSEIQAIYRISGVGICSSLNTVEKLASQAFDYAMFYELYKEPILLKYANLYLRKTKRQLLEYVESDVKDFEKFKRCITFCLMTERILSPLISTKIIELNHKKNIPIYQIVNNKNITQKGRKCVIWGIKDEYEKIVDKLNFEIIKGNIEIVALCCQSKDIHTDIYDGYPLVSSEKLIGMDFDILIIANKGSFKVINAQAEGILKKKSKILNRNAFSIVYYEDLDSIDFDLI